MPSCSNQPDKMLNQVSVSKLSRLKEISKFYHKWKILILYTYFHGMPVTTEIVVQHSSYKKYV